MKSAQEAVTVTGVVPDHVDPLLRVAKELNAFILIRPVNLQATGLIKANFDTKDLHCKGKSSDWGPQAGFICVDQSLSKKAKADDVVKNALVEKPHAHIAEVPLVLPKVRLEELVRLKMFKKVQQRGGTWDSVVSAVPNEPGKPERYFGLGEISNPERISSAHLGKQLEEPHRTWLSKLPAQYPAGTPCYPVYELASADDHSEENAKVVMVAANNDAKKVPLTADYDVLALCPSLSNYASTYKLLTENLKTPQQAVDSALKKAGVTEEQIKAVRKLAVARRWKALANTIRTGLGQFDAGRSRAARELTWSYVLQKRKVAEAEKNPKSAEELADLKEMEKQLLDSIHETQKIGLISDFGVKAKDAMNAAVHGAGYKGNDVVHHGFEMDNLAYPEGGEKDWPVCVFCPGGRVLALENATEAATVAQDIVKLGYLFYVNRSYLESDATPYAPWKEFASERKGTGQKAPVVPPEKKWLLEPTKLLQPSDALPLSPVIEELCANLDAALKKTFAGPPGIVRFSAARKGALGVAAEAKVLRLQHHETAVLSWEVEDADGVELTSSRKHSDTPPLQDMLGSHEVGLFEDATSVTYTLVAVQGAQRSKPETVRIEDAAAPPALEFVGKAKTEPGAQAPDHHDGLVLVPMGTQVILSWKVPDHIPGELKLTGPGLPASARQRIGSLELTAREELAAYVLSIGAEQAKVEVHAHDKHTPHSPMATLHAAPVAGRRAVAPAAVDSSPAVAPSAQGPQHGRRAVAGKP